MEQAKVPTVNPPELLAADILSAGKIRLRWLTGKGAEKYIVKRCDTEDGKLERIAVLKKSELSFIDTNVELDKTYYYTVSSFKRLSKTETINRASRKISATVEIIPPPTMNSAELKGSTAVLSWSPTEKEVDGYVILRRYDFMKKPLSVAKTEGEGLTFTDEKIVPGQLYHYSVQAYRSLDDGTMVYGEASAEKCVFYIDAPSVLKVKTKLWKKVDFSLRLTAGADGYVLFRSDEKNGKYVEVARSNEEYDFSLKDTGKKKAKKAYYKAACFKKLGEKEYIGPAGKVIEVKYK